MIVIIDYDMGNVGSIKNILDKIGNEETIISRNHNDIQKADKLILPGVGAFDSGMANLEKYDLVTIIKDQVIEHKKMLLGICLGMQLIGESSEEGEKRGLSLIPFCSRRFDLPRDYKIPHMGWDNVEICDENNTLLSGIIDKKPRYYFVHSYHAVCEEKYVLMKCKYGYEFAAAIYHENIVGVQFHPEKSHRFGMELLSSILRIE